MIKSLPYTEQSACVRKTHQLIAWRKTDDFHVTIVRIRNLCDKNPDFFKIKPDATCSNHNANGGIERGAER